jgi:uncharacterized membrane protein
MGMGVNLSQKTLSSITGRLSFIDFTRGTVMLIMAWDHVSGFWHELHHGGEGILGRGLPYASTLWFLERFVSHWCAPTFIFLAGIVLAMSTARRLERRESQMAVTAHIIVRGVVLLLLEAFLVSPAFDLPVYYFGVIACIGVSFILFSVLRRLPRAAILVASLVIVVNHTFLDIGWISLSTDLGRYLRVIIYEPNFNWWPFVGLYPIIPWIGVMGLGWYLGSILPKLDAPLRRVRDAVFITGVSSVALFFIVRWLNSFGVILARQGNTLVDWLYVAKYPPSVAFLLWGLGGMCLFMALGLQLQMRPGLNNRVTSAIHDIGKTPLFFYVAHLWLFRLRLPGVTQRPFPLEMYQTFAFWVVGNIVLWALCRRYLKLKRAHPNSVLKYV